MIPSAQEIFSDSQALTTSAASTNIIDLGAPGTTLGAPKARNQDIGKGRPIPIVVQLLAAAGGTSPTIQAALQVATDEAFSSPKTVRTSETITDGAAGARINIFYIPEDTDLRYLRLNYTTGGTSPTHTVWAGIVMADSTSDKSE